MQLVIRQGATLDRLCTLKDRAGNPWPLAGYSGACEVRDRHGNLKGTIAVEFVEPVQTSGQLRLKMDPAATAVMPVGLFFSDVLLRPDGEGATYRTATFTVKVEKRQTIPES
jgi:hypothetical protein